VLHGDDPARAIVDFAGDDGTIVMTTHGRSGLNRLFAGSVTTGVVAHSQRAVFVWRPEVAE
jgi:nucleotide-binding universal stress UspA family protein